MPLEEPPEIFGFHKNADITKNLQESNEILSCLLKIGDVQGTNQLKTAHGEGSAK